MMNERGTDEVEESRKCGRMSYRLYCRTEGGGEVIAIMVQVLFKSNDVLTYIKQNTLCLLDVILASVNQTVLYKLYRNQDG